MSKNYFDMEVMKYWSYPSSFKGDRNEKTEFLVKTGQYVGARKVDGEHARYIKQNGQIGLLSRSRAVDGTFANKLSKVPHLAEFLNKVVPDNSIVVGELYLPGETNSSEVGSIMRCLDPKAIQRQEKNKIHFYIFDVWAWDGVELFSVDAEKRFAKLKELEPILENEYTSFAIYYEGEELWDKIGEWLQAGEEGAVISKTTCKVYEKRTPAYETIKIKKELLKDIDVFFTGKAKVAVREYNGKYVTSWIYWYDISKGTLLPEGEHFKEYELGQPIIPVTKNFYYDIPGSFAIGVLRNGEEYELGYISGVTDEIKEDFLANPKKYQKRPCIVSAMEVGNDGGLRHPKFVKFRDDITIEDCTYSKIFGHD